MIYIYSKKLQVLQAQIFSSMDAACVLKKQGWTKIIHFSSSKLRGERLILIKI